MENQSGANTTARQDSPLLSQDQFRPGIIKERMLVVTDTIANGDMVYGDGNNNFLRLPIGTEGQILEIVSDTPTWSTPIPTIQYIRENTTNTTVTTAYMQTGWGTFDVLAGASVGSGTTTLPHTFATKIVSVVVNLIGATFGTVTDITSFTTSATSIGLTEAFFPDSITTSGFKVSLKASGNAGLDTHYGYSWIAIGI